MRSSRKQAEANRERVVATAVQLFHRHGIDNVSIADVMTAASLTHGAFYKQFTSKEALTCEACTQGLAESLALLSHAAGAGTEPLRSVVEAYLSAEHRDLAGPACTLAALAADAGRGSKALQRVFAQGATRLAQALDELAESPPGDARDPPGLPDFTLLANLVGAVVLARAVSAADPALSDHILAGMARHLTSKKSDRS